MRVVAAVFIVGFPRPVFAWVSPRNFVDPAPVIKGLAMVILPIRKLIRQVNNRSRRTLALLCLFVYSCHFLIFSVLTRFRRA